MEGIIESSDFRSTAEWAEWLWNVVWPFISSSEALRIYALTIIAIVIASAAYIAYRAKKKLTQIQNKAVSFSFPGPDPSKEDTIAKRKKELGRRVTDELLPFRDAMWRLLLAGFVVPTVVFTFGAVNYAWFDPFGLPYFDRFSGQPVYSTDGISVTLFIVNQFSHGALFDVLEVFHMDISTVSNNPNNWWFSSAVLLYRTMVSAFVVALVIASAQFFFVTTTYRRKIDAEVRRFRKEERKFAAT
ncbi:MAG: hypothetical protein KF769_08980 [Parvibaculum sp.]|nr:hypothetical protein [Parvibaculum sp.]